jgi:hypothetical protein
MTQLLKATLVSSLLACTAFTAYAQQEHRWSNEYSTLNTGNNNIIKLNVAGLAVSNSIGIIYERLEEKKVSHNFGLRIMFPGKWPATKLLENQLRALITDAEYEKSPFDAILGAKFGGLSINYDLRKYLGRKVGRGIFIGLATHADWTRMNTNIRGSFSDKSGYNIPVAGNFFSFGAGLNWGWHIPIGQQWSIETGASTFGNYNLVNLNASSFDFGFDDSELKQLNDVLGTFKNGIFNASASVTNRTVDAKTAFPYGSVRYTLAVGYRFMDKKIYR